MDVVVFADPDGRVAIAVPVEHTAAEVLAAGLDGHGPGTIMQSEDMPHEPGAVVFAAAWRWNGTGVAVDLPAARDIRATQLAATAATLATRLATAALPLLLDGKSTEVATLQSLRRAVLETPDLAAIADLETLAAWEPPSFGDARNALA